MKMVRNIAILVDKLSLGGVQRTAIEEVRCLTNIGMRANLLSMKKGDLAEIGSLLGCVGVEYLEDNAPKMFKVDFRFPGFSFFSLFHLTTPFYAPFTHKKSYDMIIAHGTYTCFTAYMLKRIKDIPYLSFIHDPITYILPKIYFDTSLRRLFPTLLPLGARMDRMIMNASEAVILPSNYHLDLIRKLTHRLIRVVYPGVEATKIISGKRGNYFIAVSRWEKGKKPFFILNVLKKLREEGIRAKLLMVGPWRPLTLRERFLQEAKENDLLDQIELYGFVGSRELSKLYMEARALIHPTIEAFGMIGLEAAAHGCPFVIPRGSGVTELFKHGVHSFFPEEGKVNEYVEYVAKFSADERLAWKMGHEAWKIAKQYTWERHTKMLIEVLNLVRG